MVGVSLVVHFWELQSVHGFRCYDNKARTRSECIYSLYAWLNLVVRPNYFITKYIVVKLFWANY